MALDLDTFKGAISMALKDAAALNDKNGVQKEKALENVGEKLATAIDAYIRTATVSTTVTGACATPAGPGTIEGAGTGGLS